MTQLKIDVYECEDCHLIFAVEIDYNVEQCPNCDCNDLTCVGIGSMEIVEH